jgi:hypothetical protein
MQDEHVDRNERIEHQPLPPSTQPSAHGPAGAPQRNSTWPVVLGIVALVFGVAGFLGNLWGTVATSVAEGLVSSMTGQLSGQEEEVVGVVFEITRSWRVWTIGVALIGALVSAMLLVGGILLLLRRAAAAPLLKLWAVARMVMVIVGGYVGLQVQRETMAAMHELMGAEMGQIPPGLVAATTAFGMMFGIVFGWALPVFVLVWFARQKIKDEVDGWM